MAETLLSPGVLTRENDTSQITQGPIVAGAAIVGPTVKGPVNIPTLVTSYSDYLNKFGGTFISGGTTNEYLTSISAYNYFQQGGDSLLVTRAVSGSFSPATSTITNNVLATTASVTVSSASLAPFVTTTGSFSINGITIAITGSTTPANTSTAIYIASGSTPANTVTAIVTAFNASSSNALYSSALQYVTASVSSSTGLFFNTKESLLNTTFDDNILNAYTYISGSTITYFGGSTNYGSFILETLSAGAIQNSTSSVGTNGILPSGSTNNVRFEIVGASTGSGTFSLLIRQGNDTDNSKIILEAWNNLSLDPNQQNYIEAVIGNQATDVSQGYTNVSGDYTNKSRYVRVKQVLTSSLNYFDNNGQPVASLAGTIPLVQTGSFGGATGTNCGIYGLSTSDYTSSLNLLGNKDEFKFNVITVPGQTTTTGNSTITTLIGLVQDRGDAIAIIDVTDKGATINTAVANALSYDNSYAATYYPWVQVNAPNTGKLTWVPPSTIIPSVFAYNDRVSAPWFAPAGFTRGGLSVIQAERKLSPTNRDTLYLGNVNAIATFPGQGVVAYGQKTLQKKASALDRINVRRLLIELKSHIGQVANTLVFEQNSNSTRNRFLSQVNPYLDSIQQRQGLYAFKVVMDDTNNTADVIDRNQLVGQIFIQPTKTAEFIILDFNVTPTGATF
ncbi:phage tail sheath subtilisin-like domain-containing protein [Candidatus Pelagibacter sp.]|nr:phage tail sheath subtilisin-like domain-containing protein [Candidatus Pelagibacter sp.]